MITEVCGLKSNTISKLIKFQENLLLVSCRLKVLETRYPYHRHAWLCCLSGTHSFHKEGPEKMNKNIIIKKIRYLTRTFWLNINTISGIFSTLKTNCVRFSIEWVNSWILKVKGSRFQLVGYEETIWDRFEHCNDLFIHHTQCYL